MEPVGAVAVSSGIDAAFVATVAVFERSSRGVLRAVSAVAGAALRRR